MDFTAHIILALLIAGLISSAINNIKFVATNYGFKLEGMKLFVLSILISMIISFGYTTYYAMLSPTESILVYAIVVFGAQGFHQVTQGGKHE